MGFATVSLARHNAFDPAWLGWAVPAIGVFIACHVAVRMYAPLADPTLLPMVALLCGIGLTMCYRIDPAIARRQVLWVAAAALGMCVLLAFMRDVHTLESYRYLIGLGGVAALVATIGPLGTNIRGAKLWIDFGPMQIQPGEFAKLAIVIFLAAYLREHRDLLRMKLSPKHLGPLLMVWGASLGLLVLMNDFGTSLLFYGTFLLMVFVATGRLGYTAAGLAMFAAGTIFVYRTAGHVHERFSIWLEPWKDPQGAGYQLVQGLFALADGGLTGRGLGRAYLVTPGGQTIVPDLQTDFIFAAIGDEMGFIGAAGLLIVYALITWRGFAIATRANDGFTKLLAFGLTATFALQTAIIVGGVVRLLPLTGQTLPFVSYGGSSVLANFLLVGILLALSHEANTSQRRVRRESLL
jgi:cell division protein FtsW (lipid II flippase)